MKKTIYAVMFVYVCSVLAVAFPVKSDIYGSFPNIAKETKKILVSAYKEDQKKATSPKEVKAVNFDVQLFNESVNISSAEEEIELWNESYNTPILFFSRIESNVAALDMVVKTVNNDVLFTAHIDPRSLASVQYFPVVINQDNKTSNMWDSSYNAFEHDEAGNLIPATQVELTNQDNNPFTYNGVQVDRDMLDGQGLRTHNLYALETGSYNVFVKATLNNGQEESTYVQNISVSNSLPTVGLNNHQAQNFKVAYYNNNIVIESKDNKTADIKILDIKGVEVASAKLNGKTYINMADKAHGVYIVNVKGKGVNLSKKVLVK